VSDLGAPGTVPIACTLDLDDRPARVDEWRRFFGDSVSAVTQESGVVRLLLAPTEAALVAAASLAQREKECCAFFDFAIELEAEQRWLRVNVPESADTMLHAFVEMLTGP
jgi:uncharacterized heparinase superfamily protein